MMRTGRSRDVLLAIYGVAMATSITGTLWAGYLLVFLWALRLTRDASNQPPSRSPLDFAIIAYAIWGVACTMMTGSTNVGKTISSQGAFLLYFLSVRDLSNDENVRWIRWMVIASAVMGVLGLLQFGLRITWEPTTSMYMIPDHLKFLPHWLIDTLAMRGGRAVGSRSHPLTFAEGMLVALFMLIILPRPEDEKARRRHWLMVGLIVCGTVVSLARGVWIGMALGGLVLTILWWNRKSVRVWALVCILAGAGAVAAVPKIRERALSIVNPAAGNAADRISRFTRFALWQATVSKWLERPWAGQGMRGIRIRLPLAHTREFKIWSEAHNIYLQVLGERGIIGFGLFLWMLILCVMGAANAPPGWREAGLAMIAGMLMAGMTESWIKDREIDMIFWAVIGAIERARLERGRT